MRIQIYKTDLMSYTSQFSNKMKQYFLEVTPMHLALSCFLHSVFSVSSELIHLSRGTSKEEKKEKKSITLKESWNMFVFISSEELRLTTPPSLATKPPEFLTSVLWQLSSVVPGFSPVSKKRNYTLSLTQEI